MQTPFDHDVTLVQGRYQIADSLEPPPDYGVFGIQWPYAALAAPEKLQRVRLILWSCMDRRVLRPLYDKARTWGYQPDEILMLVMAGGPLQLPEDRAAILRQVFTRLEGKLPELQKIWMVAHTGICYGFKHFLKGKTAVEAARPEILARAAAHGTDPELYVTQLILPGACHLLPDAWRQFGDCAVAEPVEASQSVKIYSSWFTAEDAKNPADVFVLG